MIARRAAHLAIRVYQLTLSGLIGRQCRHWPSCSDYTDAAIGRHGLWAGGWMGFSRICRCGPFGTHGIDLVPERIPGRARWWMPWRYGRWRGVEAPPSPFVCEAADGDAASVPVTEAGPTGLAERGIMAPPPRPRAAAPPARGRARAR